MTLLPSAPDIGAIARLSRLAPLDAEELDALSLAEKNSYVIGANREILAEGQPVGKPKILLSGWACRCRFFRDGRRQILGLLLPGELIGMCHHSDPLAVTSIVTLTRTTLCLAPVAKRDHGGLAEAYARSGATEQFYLYRQIARLGRLNAYDRLVDLLLEIRHRLFAAGIGSGESFPLPITQEVMADLLGLTGVHVNRTLQRLRSEGRLDLRGSIARLSDPERLSDLVEHRDARVTEGPMWSVADRPRSQAQG